MKNIDDAIREHGLVNLKIENNTLFKRLAPAEKWEALAIVGMIEKEYLKKLQGSVLR